MSSKNKNIICFGEVLFDVFPRYKKIGGAPLNVAVRMQYLGHNTSIISKVGQDADGQNILSFLENKGIGTQNINEDSSQKTGSVSVLMHENGSASYNIDFPSAWDYIELTKNSIHTVKACDVLFYGSLAGRNHQTRNCLLELLKHARFKVFDVNLRAPHYTFELLNEFMLHANFIKFNEEEIMEISQSLGSNSKDLYQNMKFVAEKTNTNKICVTKGAQGAVLLLDNKWYDDHDGYQVEVVNTVGAGDSFLASLIHGLLNNHDPKEALDFACAIGSLVAKSEGANPEIREKDIRTIKK